MSKIRLVVPAYNEELNIEPFFARCEEVASGSSHEFSYLFVDDGSKDGTYDAVTEICQKNPDKDVRGLSFSRNFGKEAAIMAGLEGTMRDKEIRDDNSESHLPDYVVLIDADLQQDPEYVIKMADYLDANPDFDCVCCYQESRKESGFMKFVKKRFYRIIDRSSDTEFVENASDFRMMRMNVVDAVLRLREYHRFSKGIFSWVGFNTHYMPYEVKERANGETKWTFRKLMRYGIDGIIGFSTAPLRLATWIGSLTTIAAIIFLTVSVIQRFVSGTDAPGYTTIVCLILIIGGVQMVLLGIIGEYISRMYMETKNRPIYLIKDEIRSNTTK